MEDLAVRSATALARLARSREVSPVEVVEACLARVERYNPAVNAVVTLNPRALDDAGDLELRLVRGEEVGLLAGLPVGIKDVTPVAGLRTTYGSALYRDHIPAEDALVVRRLRDAGAVILGKTNCAEFAAGAHTFNDVFGRTRNPWDPTRSAGGSTGGGAAGLATGMIALAEGTDLGGSLRIPASFCGVVGLRPSVGLVPTYPTDWAWDTLQVEGPVARTAEDVAPVSRVLREVRPSAHAVHGGPAVPGGPELSRHRGRQEDGDVRGLDRAHVRIEPHRPPGRFGAVRARSRRPAGGPADRRQAVRGGGAAGPGGPGPAAPPHRPSAPRLERSVDLLQRVLAHEREAQGVEVVVGDLPEQLLGPCGVAGALRGDRKLILDVRVQQIALPQVCGRFIVLALIERDESRQLVHRLELAR